MSARTNDLVDVDLFGAPIARDSASPEDRQRLRNRERQMAYRRRHMFAPPLIESPRGGTRFPEAMSTQ